MNLFKKPKKELPPLISDEELDATTYDEVVDFLTAVNDSDLEKIIKVVHTYRRAHADVSKITGLGGSPAPSIFEQQTMEPIKHDTEIGDFMEEPAKPKGKKAASKNASNKGN